MALVLHDATVAWMTPGTHVRIHSLKQEFQECLSFTWVIEEAPFDGEVILRASHEPRLIRVKVEKVAPATLAVTPTHQQRNDFCFNLDVPFHWKVEAFALSALHGEDHHNHFDIDQFLGRWINLPGLGGNSIMFRRHTNPHQRTLLMFPRLESLG